MGTSCHDCKNPPALGFTRCDVHRAAALVRHRKWRAANRQSCREYGRREYERNKEKIKAASRAWAAANKERKSAASKAWAAANPDAVLNSRMKRFGLTAAEYKSRLAAQGGRCAICATDRPGGRGRFAVDHDHATGAVRGLLCTCCNSMLGQAQDDTERLAAAIVYLHDGGFGRARA